MDNVLVVLNYNDSKTTEGFLKNAQFCNALQKIIVVDNCSTTGDFRKIQQYASDKVDVIQSEKNGGYAYGNNFGIRYAIDKYSPEVCFVSNPDVTFEDETIVKMQSCLRKNEDIAVVAPIVNQGYNVWHLPRFWGVIESLFLVWHNFHKQVLKKRILHSSKPIIKVGAVEGSFFAISTKAYEAISGFDERTFLYYEENILAKRLRDQNLNVCVLVDCRYNHFHSVSIKKQYKSKARAFKLFYPSMILYLEEYLHINKFQKKIFDFAFCLAHIERLLYDCVCKML